MRRGLLFLSCAAPLAATLAVAQRSPSPIAPAAAAVALAPRRAHPLADAHGLVPITVRLQPGEDAAALGLLEVAPGIGARWVEPGDLSALVEGQAARRPWVSPPLRLLGDVAGSTWTRAVAAHQKGHRGAGVVVGVIDTGIDTTHPDLRVPGTNTSRVAWLLDLANKPLGLHPELEAKFGCTQNPKSPCAVLTGAESDALNEGKNEGVPPSDGVGHGTHVASLAAGNHPKYTGVAPDATLVAVRVTRSTGGESVTDADLLNAVRFVFDRADALAMPAVVNVSLGGDYGPHDGTSPLEEGLAAFVGPTHPGRAIVVAAGNSGGVVTDQAGMSYGAHTETRSVAGATTRVLMKMPAATRQARGSAYVWITFQPGDDVQVGVELNGSPVLGPFGRGEQGALDEVTGQNPYLGVLNGVVADNSPLSARTNGAIVLSDGTFEPGAQLAIVLRGSGTAQLWVQGLGEAEFGSATGGLLFVNPLKQGTVNVPATHPSLLAVGCTLNRLKWPTRQGALLEVTQVGSLKDPPGDTICYFSGSGPNALGVSKPEIAAPGGFLVGAMSRDADPATNPGSMFSSPPSRCGDTEDCYVVDDLHAVASGTSMSAPQVSGAVALLLEQNRQLTQSELVALLQAGARKFEGLVPIEAQGGPGALDIDASLEVLSPPATRAPTPISVERSWLHLSTGFARPDGRWPVTGTLLLRDAEGRAADGFNHALLQLQVDNGTPSRPLHRIAPGLWQFDASAPPGSGGSLMQMRILLGDELLLERELPIAVDVWNILGMPEPRGGCGR